MDASCYAVTPAKPQAQPRCMDTLPYSNTKLGNFVFEDMDRNAPDTKPRNRKPTDFMDAFTYWRGRVMKQFNYFYRTTNESMRTFVWQVTMLAVWFRLVCIWFGLGGVIRNICAAIGARATINTQLLWYQRAAGAAIVTEHRLWGSVWIAQRLVTSLPGTVWQSSWLCFKVLAVGWILTGTSICTFAVIIVMQRRAFYARWEAGGYDEHLTYIQGRDEPVARKRWQKTGGSILQELKVLRALIIPE